MTVPEKVRLATNVPESLIDPIITYASRTKSAHYSKAPRTCPSAYLHVGGVVGNVHERGVDHLVVDGVLRGAAEATGTRIQVVDEQRAHLTLLDEVRCLAVTLEEGRKEASGDSSSKKGISSVNH